MRRSGVFDATKKPTFLARAAACSAVPGTAIRPRHWPQQISGELLSAEVGKAPREQRRFEAAGERAVGKAPDAPPRSCPRGPGQYGHIAAFGLTSATSRAFSLHRHRFSRCRPRAAFPATLKMMHADGARRRHAPGPGRHAFDPFPQEINPA